MKKLMLVAALSGCAVAQNARTGKCPTAPALVGDALIMSMPMYLAVDAYVMGDYPSMVFGLLMAGTIAATDVILTDTCDDVTTRR